MYIWKLWEVVAAEGSPERIIAKAQQASISSLWVKVADGTSAFRNVGDQVTPNFKDLIARAHQNNIEMWGWQVPHCDTATVAKNEAKVFGDLVEKFGLDGLIMDAEGTSAFFHGGLAEAKAYGAAMRDIADRLGRPLGISSNDIPQNIEGWTPKFTEIAKKADFNWHASIAPSRATRI